MSIKKCAICEKPTSTWAEAALKNNDSISIFCTLHRKRICVNCAGKIWDLLTPESPKTKTRYFEKVAIPNDLRWAVFERDNFTCKICGARKHLHCDHIHPESKGGEATMENLQTLCSRCNRSKGSR